MALPLPELSPSFLAVLPGPDSGGRAGLCFLGLPSCRSLLFSRSTFSHVPNLPYHNLRRHDCTAGYGDCGWGGRTRWKSSRIWATAGSLAGYARFSAGRCESQWPLGLSATTLAAKSLACAAGAADQLRCPFCRPRQNVERAINSESSVCMTRVTAGRAVQGFLGTSHSRRCAPSWMICVRSPSTGSTARIAKYSAGI